MKKIFYTFFSLVALFNGTNLVADSIDTEEALPKSWYQLPEEGGMSTNDDSLDHLTQKQEEALDRLFSVNATAFEKMEDQHRTDRDKKWRLEACMLDLTLTLSGTMGVLVAKGDATASLYWKRNQPKDTVVEVSEPLDASFSNLDTRDTILTQVEPVIKAVVASHGVKDEKTFRDNLTNQLMDYHTLLQYLTVNTDAAWQVSRFRVDFSFDISGKVNPATTVGGGARLRFEWHLVPKTDRMFTHLPPSRAGENLKRLVEDLAKELTQANLTGSTASGFDLKTIKLGLGIFGDGKFGVVKVGLSLWGYVYLSPNTDYRGKQPIRDQLTSIPLITGPLKENEIAWVNAHQVRHESFSTEDDQRVEVFSIAGEAFRRGIIRAEKISQKLADRAAKHEKKWRVYQLKTEFVLSLAGTTGLVTIGGAGSVELEFQKP